MSGRRRTTLEKSFERSVTTKDSSSPSSDEEALIIPLVDDLELELELEPVVKEKPKQFQNSFKIVDLKYPFDIKNLQAHDVTVYDDFGCSKQHVYDVSCFSSAKYTTKSVCYEISKQYPGYQYRIYSYRATKRMSGTEVKKMKFIFKVDNKKQFVHANVELY